MDLGKTNDDIAKEAAHSMDVNLGDVGDMEARGVEEITASSMPTVSTKGKSVVDVDDDDFVDRTPLAKRYRKKAAPLLSPYTQITSADMSSAGTDIDETNIVYYTSLHSIDKGDRETISTYIEQKGALPASAGVSRRHIIQILQNEQIHSAVSKIFIF